MSIIWSGLTEEGVIVPVQVTAEGKVVAVGDGPEGEYLKLTGGNLTGDLTVNEQIKLATDGSSTFAGDVEVGNEVGNTSTEEGVKLFKSGAIYAAKNGGNEPILYGMLTDGNTATSRINADGSAFFAGSITAGDYPGQAKTIAASTLFANINPKTAAIANSGVSVYTDGSNNGFVSLKNTVGDSNIVLNGTSGSAAFAADKCGFTPDGEIYFMSRSTRYKIVVSNGICAAEEYSVARQLKEEAERFIADKRETKPSDPQGEVTTDNDNAS